ncbi:hypothetical protein DSO57_1035962 [Entomophthora muscae]|uniref:Uncharacterized protein n=1 Tax=Entomophthora muscae TaxID=34485 RepID=A0ACC2SNP1_9FUNG|nr:hypothetical protein DSO57_1035962 [Entomophthora muscae]
MGACSCLLLVPGQAHTLLPAGELWAHSRKIGCCRYKSHQEDKNPPCWLWAGLIADKTRLSLAIDLTFAKTNHEKKIIAVFNKLCEFTEAFLLVLSGLTILLLWNLRPKSGNQTQNLDPLGRQAYGPPARIFLGLSPPQADAEVYGPSSEKDQAKEIIAPSEVPITTPNGSAKATTISFMSLKSTPATTQEPAQSRGTSPQPGPMIITLEQDNQVAKLGVSTNERTPGLSAILLLLDPSTQFPQPCLSQCPDDPPMENVKFGSGVLYRPKDPTLQTYCHF